MPNPDPVTVLTFAFENSFEEELAALQGEFEQDRSEKLEQKMKKVEVKDNFTRIVFDLETTGCKNNCDIGEGSNSLSGRLTP